MFATTYGLQFTIEQSGSSLISLEVFIKCHFDENNFFTHFCKQWKQIIIQPLKHPRLALKKWVSPSSVNAKYIIKCYTPSACSKSLIYSHSNSSAIRNLQGFASLLFENGYPKHWWRHYVNNVIHLTRTGVG